MKRSRLLLFVAGAVVVLLVLGFAVVFSSTFQTWVVRRAMADHPELHASVGSVSAGLKRVELRDVYLQQPGARLTLPLVEIDLPLTAAVWGEHVQITRLVANGWTLDLSKSEVASVTPPATVPDTVTNRDTTGTTEIPTPAASATTTAQTFAGIFAELEVPFDLAVEGVQLGGDVILPDSRGRANVSVTGGGLGAGKEGRFDFVAVAALTDPKVKAVTLRGALVAAMDTPRSFRRLAVGIDTSARGEKFPEGVKLHADLAAARAAAGETYTVSVAADGQDVIIVKAALPRNARIFEGTWKVNVRDIELAPFMFGQPLPTFAAMGEGKFAGDADFEAINVTGSLKSTLEGLEAILPELVAVGELTLVADFDLAKRGAAFGVQKFAAAVSAAEPVATVHVLQPFEFNLQTGGLHTTDATHELVGLALLGVPVAWVAPFLKDLQVVGGFLRGEVSAAARNGGMTVQSTTPLVMDGIGIADAGDPLLERVDLALHGSADYTPQGWQAEVINFKATRGDATLVSLEAKMGQLTGNDR
jgi:hypothetical protein